MDPSIQSRQLVVGGRTVRYLAAGPIGQPASAGVVVFLHAFPLNAGMWAGQLAALPAGWAALAPDFRGFGESTADTHGLPPRADADLDDYVDDVLAVLDAERVPRAVVCGCSMGGYTAFALLRRAADRAAGFVLVDTRATADTERDRGSRSAMLELLAAQGPGAIAESMLPRLLGATTQAGGPGAAAMVRGLAGAASASGVGHAIVRMMNRADATPLLGSISRPTLVIAGEEDVLIPAAEAEALTRGIPGSRLAMIPRAGHLPNLEQPEAFNAMLRSWLLDVEHQRLAGLGPSGAEAAADAAESRTPNPEPPIPNPH
jgi:pimeloyl-ACP methyl ester carboxylesterase